MVMVAMNILKSKSDEKSHAPAFIQSASSAPAQIPAA
jgi:hypothetical protein